MLLKDVGVSEDDVSELADAFRHDNYALIRATYANPRNNNGADRGD